MPHALSQFKHAQSGVSAWPMVSSNVTNLTSILFIQPSPTDNAQSVWTSAIMSSTSATAKLDQLPDDCLRYIVCCLDQTDLPRLMGVSKRLHDLTYPALYKRLILTERDDFRPCSESGTLDSRYIASTRFIEVHFHRKAQLPTVLRGHLDTLETLTLTSERTVESYERFRVEVALTRSEIIETGFPRLSKSGSGGMVVEPFSTITSLYKLISLSRGFFAPSNAHRSYRIVGNV